MLLVSPTPAEVVELQLAGCQISYHGVLPVGQLHRQAFDFAAEKFVLALHRRGQGKSLAGGPDGSSVADFRFYGNKMAQCGSPVSYDANLNYLHLGRFGLAVFGLRQQPWLRRRSQEQGVLRDEIGDEEFGNDGRVLADGMLHRVDQVAGQHKREQAGQNEPDLDDGFGDDRISDALLGNFAAFAFQLVALLPTLA